MLTVRTAISDDAPATPALFRAVVEEGAYTVRKPSEFGLTEAEEREYIEEGRETPGSLCLVSTEDGGVVGMVLASGEPYQRTHHFADVDSLWGAIRLYEKHGFTVEGRCLRDIEFGDGGYADTVATGLLVEEGVPGAPA